MLDDNPYHGGEKIGLEDYDGSAAIIKKVNITIEEVWCAKCKGFIDIGDLEDAEDDETLMCPACGESLLRYS